MEIKRKRFQGVLNIISFNRHFYIIGLTFLSLLVVSQFWFNWSYTLKWIVIVLFLYGLIAPLIVSAYVYDFSKYYEFSWLKKIDLEDLVNGKIVNINAGFDETSFILKNRFAKSELKVFDFYNHEKHTEAAIKRARKVSLTYPNTEQITTDFIPLEDETVDLIFLLSSAHEIRSNNEKATFLKECNRVLKTQGKIIIVEHLRDLPNFLAFSVGFTHFFSQKTWKSVFTKANLKLSKEIKFTPFMSVFSLSKQI